MRLRRRRDTSVTVPIRWRTYAEQLEMLYRYSPRLAARHRWPWTSSVDAVVMDWPRWGRRILVSMNREARIQRSPELLGLRNIVENYTTARTGPDEWRWTPRVPAPETQERDRVVNTETGEEYDVHVVSSHAWTVERAEPETQKLRDWPNG